MRSHDASVLVQGLLTFTWKYESYKGHHNQMWWPFLMKGKTMNFYQFYNKLNGTPYEKDIPAPVKYGYAAVGRVIAGPAALDGGMVFVLHPHQTRFVVPRDAARMLEVQGAMLADRSVRDLPQRLRRGDLLVYNDTSVIKARLRGKSGEAGVEVTLHKRVDERTWRAFARPAKKLRAGDTVRFSADFSARVEEKGDGGEERDDGEILQQQDRHDALTLRRRERAAFLEELHDDRGRGQHEAGAGHEGDAGRRRDLGRSAEHGTREHRLWCRDRRVGIAHGRPGDHGRDGRLRRRRRRGVHEHGAHGRQQALFQPRSLCP